MCSVTVEVPNDGVKPGPYCLKTREVILSVPEHYDEGEAREYAIGYLQRQYDGYGKVKEIDTNW